MNRLRLGRVDVSAVVERAGPTRPTWLLPDAAPEAVERHRDWLAPHFLDAKGRFLQSIHTFVVRAPGLTVLVDTCVGNDKDRGGRQPFHMMRTTFLDDLRAAGVAPDAVDVVLCTHLHVDHVGWNTRLDDGRWVPTFPRARYLFARREWEHWSSEADADAGRVMADSVTPIVDAGLDPDRKLTTDDLVGGDNLFVAATGVTDGALLNGVKYTRDGAETDSIVIRSRSGTVRRVQAWHELDKLTRFSGREYR